jgi:hypothetical protein
MGLLDSILGGVGGLSAIGGLIGANQARQQAQQQQQQALNAYAQAMDSQYQNVLANNNRTLMGMAGQGGDAIRNLGANLGSSLAGAGVWNSSATAGALAQAQRDEDTSLTNLAAQNYYNANQLYNQGQTNLANMRLGLANANYAYANQDLGGARQGLGSFLESLAQSNLLGRHNPSQTQGGQQDYQNYIDAMLRQNGITDADLYTQPQGASDSSGGTAPPPPSYPGWNDINILPNQRTLLGGAPALGTPGYLGYTTQSALGLSGANASRTQLPLMNGTFNQGAGLWGNAGGIGNLGDPLARISQQILPGPVAPGR